MSRKSTLDALFGQKPAMPAGAPNPAVATPVAATPAVSREDRPLPVRTGAVAAMGASLQQWQQAQRHSEDLQAQLARAQSLVELDPQLIDPAPVRDRLPMTVDPGFEAQVDSVRENGQQVPVLVRPHPAAPGRFQAAFGHRRIAAAKRLSRPVRALVAELSDAQLVTAQGQENAQRHDLTFIERALFAQRLEAAGFDRALIVAALSIHKADLSRALAIAAAIPEPVIAAIGPAPKAGRARWVTVAEGLADAAARTRVERVLAEPAFETLDSDQRLQSVLTALAAPASSERAAKKPKSLVAIAGKPAAALQPDSRRPAIRFDEGLAPGFSAFVAARMPGLFEEFRQESGGLREGRGGRSPRSAAKATGPAG